MIIANITTFEGQDMNAEHYYCGYRILLEERKPPVHSMGSFGEIELMRKITSTNEAVYFNKKDSARCWHIGSELNRFDSIEDIHKELLRLFSDQTIVTYYEGAIFKEMLCYISGVNVGYSYFGEVWLNVPRSCYYDLLPAEGKIKVKCVVCGTEYPLWEVAQCGDHQGRGLVQLYERREMDDICDCFDLVWNVVL